MTFKKKCENRQANFPRREQEVLVRNLRIVLRTNSLDRLPEDLSERKSLKCARLGRTVFGNRKSQGDLKAGNGVPGDAEESFELVGWD